MPANQPHGSEIPTTSVAGNAFIANQSIRSANQSGSQSSHSASHFVHASRASIVANANAAATGSANNTGAKAHGQVQGSSNSNSKNASSNPIADPNRSHARASTSTNPPIHSYDFASQATTAYEADNDSDIDIVGANQTAVAVPEEKNDELPTSSKAAHAKTSATKPTMDSVSKLCDVMSFLNIKKAIETDVSTSSNLFTQPPSYINRAGALVSVDKSSWFFTAAEHYKSKPKLTAPTLSAETIEDDNLVRMTHFCEQPRDHQLADQLNITFSEKAFVTNLDMQSLHMPTLLRNIGAARAKIYEMDGEHKDTRSVSLILGHTAFIEIKNRYDYANMFRLWREIMQGMAERTVHMMSDANKYLKPSLCGFNPIIDLKAHEYSLGFESTLSMSSGSRYSDRVRRVRKYHLLVHVNPESEWHKANHYGQVTCLWPNVWLRDERVSLQIRTSRSSDKTGFVKLTGKAFENTLAAAANRKTVDLTAIVNRAVYIKSQNVILLNYLTEIQSAGYALKYVSFMRSADRARAKIDDTVKLSDKHWNEDFGSKTDKQQALARNRRDDQADHKMADQGDGLNDLIPEDEDDHTQRYTVDYVTRMVQVLLDYHDRTQDDQPIPLPKWLDADWALRVMHDKLHPRPLSRLQPEMTSTAARHSRNKDKAVAPTNHYIARCQGIPIDLAIGTYNTELGAIEIKQHQVPMSLRILQLLPKCSYCGGASHLFSRCPMKRIDDHRAKQKHQRRCLRCWRAHTGPCLEGKPRCGHCAGEHYLSNDNSECAIVVSMCHLIDNAEWAWHRMVNLDGIAATQLLDLNRVTLEVPALPEGAHKVMETDDVDAASRNMLQVAPPLAPLSSDDKASDKDTSKDKAKASTKQRRHKKRRKSRSPPRAGRTASRANKVHEHRQIRKPQPQKGNERAHSRSRSPSRTSITSDHRMQYRRRPVKGGNKDHNEHQDQRRKGGKNQGRAAHDAPGKH